MNISATDGRNQSTLDVCLSRVETYIDECLVTINTRLQEYAKKGYVATAKHAMALKFTLRLMKDVFKMQGKELDIRYGCVALGLYAEKLTRKNIMSSFYRLPTEDMTTFTEARRDFIGFAAEILTTLISLLQNYNDLVDICEKLTIARDELQT